MATGAGHRSQMKRKRSRDQRRIETNERHRKYEEELGAINDRLNKIADSGYVDSEVTDLFSSLPITSTASYRLCIPTCMVISPL